jgi:hypothetical protein
MRAVPDAVLRHYEVVLKRHEIPRNLYANYRKWLRYFLDFRLKYLDSGEQTVQVRLFLGKLREKRQTEAQFSRLPMPSPSASRCLVGIQRWTIRLNCRTNDIAITRHRQRLPYRQYTSGYLNTASPATRRSPILRNGTRFSQQ